MERTVAARLQNANALTTLIAATVAATKKTVVTFTSCRRFKLYVIVVTTAYCLNDVLKFFSLRTFNRVYLKTHQNRHYL